MTITFKTLSDRKAPNRLFKPMFKVVALAAVLMASMFTVNTYAQQTEKKTDSVEVKASVMEAEEASAELPSKAQPKSETRARTLERINLEVGKVSVESVIREISTGEHTGFMLFIPEANAKEVKKAWEKEIRNKTRAKIVEAKGEITLASTLIETISGNKIGVISKVGDDVKGATVLAFFDTGDQTYIEGNDEQQYNSAKAFMHDFGVEMYSRQVKNEMKAAERTLKDYEKNLRKLQKSNEKMHESIESNESNIVNTENDIRVNGLDQDGKMTELQAAKENVRAAGADKELKKTAKKELKKKMRERRRLQKQNRSMHKKIASYKAKIAKAKSDILLNVEQQKLEEKRVEKQAALVDALETN